MATLQELMTKKLELRRSLPPHVRDLIDQWDADGCWDLYSTEGFESYEAPLMEYQTLAERASRQRWTEEMEYKAQQLGIPGNTSLAAYIHDLERRIERLENRNGE